MTLTLLLIGMLSLTFDIQPVETSGTIYIKADGSIEGTTDISTVDNVTYTFMDNIYDEIVVERSNIIIDGNGYALQGTGTGNGFYLSGIDNVTIKNTTIKNYEYGISLYSSSNNTISGNNITANNGQGIRGDSSNNNAISGNNITANNDRAIWFDWSSYTSVSGNKITNNRGGIYLGMSSNNSINGNNIAANIDEYGISISGNFYIGGSSYNSIQGNNITNNYSGIVLEDSSYNSVSENNITANNLNGIQLYRSSCDSIQGNNITANKGDGIYLYESSNNSISKNSITANDWEGIYFHTSCYNNTIYHNNFINNTNQVGISYDSVNVWDDSYPSGGNYWSDYTGVDANGDGIGDTPYIIDANNTDRYPLMYSWSPLPVHNINTGSGYTTIQEAIDVSETLEGHVIFADAGTYYEHVTIDKSISLIGENRSATIIDGNGTNTVVSVEANNTVISGFTIQNGGDGIYLYDSPNCSVLDNNVNNNDLNGICVDYYSSNCSVSGNNINNNRKGIVLYGSPYCSVLDNNVNNTYGYRSMGIGLVDSPNCFVSGNKVTLSTTYGIFIDSSYNNVLRNNNMTGNHYNFAVSGDSLQHYIQDIDASNTVDGKPMYYLVNQNNLTVDASTHPSIGYLALVNSTNIAVEDLRPQNNGLSVFFAYTTSSTIKNVTAINSEFGIGLAYSSNCSIHSNEAIYNYDGILLSYSSNCSVSNNNVNNNYDGIVLTYSSSCSVSDNNVNNNELGIALALSSNNVLRNNTMVGNSYNFYVLGFSFQNYAQDIDASNTVDGNPVYYLVNQNSVTVNPSTYPHIGYLALVNSTKITVEDLTLTNNGQGVLLAYTTDSTIRNITANNNGFGIILMNSSDSSLSGNDADNNHDGIALLYSSNCSVSGNNVNSSGRNGIILSYSSNCSVSSNNATYSDEAGIWLGYCSNCSVSGNNVNNNWMGIELDDSSSNKIYHNNFINNTNQAVAWESYNNVWDDGYPSGGNYWSDYTGVDANMDGIGDSFYEIDSNNIDHYPLMGMFSDFNATSEHHVQTICNSSISEFQFNGTAICFNVTGEDGTTGFCRICIPRALMNETYQVFVNGTEVQCNLLPCSNTTHSYLYFTYNLSTQEVIIILEFPMWTSMLLLLIVLTVSIAIYKRRLLKNSISIKG